MKKAALILAVLFVSSICHATVAYDVININDNYEYVYVTGINNHNEVTGFVKINDSWIESFAFYWSQANGLISLGGYSASKINDLGQIAGNTSSHQAAVWENGHWVILFGRQNAIQINENGQVTGLISAYGDLYRPYRDDDIYSPEYISLERADDRASHGHGINNYGEVIADCGLAVLDTLYVPIFYDADGTLNIMDYNGNYDTHPRGINDRGQIVGDSTRERYGVREAVYWDSPDGQIEYMGSLGEGTGLAYSINELGKAVGFSDGRAFVWDRSTGMLDLNTMIDDSLGITLTRAMDINDDGAIVARGFDSQGPMQSYLLIPKRAIDVDVDIKPGSCPNPLSVNLKGNGLIPVAILGTEDFDVLDIDVTTITLEGVAPIRSGFDDVSTPSDGEECECNSDGPDGFLDLTLKFNRKDVLAALEAIYGDLAEIEYGADIPLTLTGMLMDDDITLEGKDCVSILNRMTRNKSN